MKYSKEIYDKDVLVEAAYSLSDTAYFHLDADEKHYLVEIVPKDPNDSSDYEKRFENELLTQQTRKIVINKTKNIRELIAARALSSTIVELGNEEAETEETGFNAQDILKDWFSNHE